MVKNKTVKKTVKTKKEVTIGGYTHTSVKKQSASNALNDLVCNYANSKGAFAFRVNSTGTYRPESTKQKEHQFEGNMSFLSGKTTKTTKGKWTTSKSKQGTSDVLICYKGLFIAVETKIKDKQLPSQKDFEQSVNASGGQYWIVRSIEEFVKRFDEV